MRPRPKVLVVDVAMCPPADVTIERIGDLLRDDFPALLGAALAMEVA